MDHSEGGSSETRVGWSRRDDRTVHVVACDFARETDAFALDGPVTHHPASGWRDYVRAMVETLRVAGMPMVGVDLAVAGDIPRGAGLSSSASMEVAVAHAMLAAAGGALDAKRIARLAQTAENEFVGMKCGIMDQLASAAGVKGAALLIDCRDLSTRPVPLPADAAVLIVHSGVERGLVEGHYNRRRAECEAAAVAMGLVSLRDATLPLLDATDMPDAVRARARHILTENARVLASADALAAGDYAVLGELMSESHASMRDDFRITVPKVDELAAIAQEAIGSDGGARMTGGGFGGAVVALLRADRVDAVVCAIRERYRTPDGEPPVTMLEHAAAGAGPLPPSN